MTMLLREIQAADRLSFNEIRDFRAAVKRGDVPGPARKITVGRRSVDVWSSEAIDKFIANSSSSCSDEVTFSDEIGAL